MWGEQAGGGGREPIVRGLLHLPEEGGWLPAVRASSVWGSVTRTPRISAGSSSRRRRRTSAAGRSGRDALAQEALLRGFDPRHVVVRRLLADRHHALVEEGAEAGGPSPPRPAWPLARAPLAHAAHPLEAVHYGGVVVRELAQRSPPVGRGELHAGRK